jgi:acyl-CoA synthetase (AMP-forming)/AMP-acid ligase II
MMAVMMKGGRFITMSKYDPKMVLQTIQEQKVTMMAGAPTMFHQLFHTPGVDDYDLASVHTCVSGASQLQPDLLEKFKKYFGRARIFSMYGLTEASPSCTVLSPELVYEKPGSVGRPQEGVELRIVDDVGKDVAEGEVGEIIIRGPNVTSSYWNAPGVTAETIREGWLHTGDMARMDGDGDIYIVDRKKDMIITGGENVYSAEVENVLRSHPKVSEASVFGVPDDKWGESVCAVVVLEGGNNVAPEELVEHCRKSIASYKKPKTILFREDLPKNPAGKVIKKEVRQWALKQG